MKLVVEVPFQKFKDFVQFHCLVIEREKLFTKFKICSVKKYSLQDDSKDVGDDEIFDDYVLNYGIADYFLIYEVGNKTGLLKLCNKFLKKFCCLIFWTSSLSQILQIGKKEEKECENLDWLL